MQGTRDVNSGHFGSSTRKCSQISGFGKDGASEAAASANPERRASAPEGPRIIRHYEMASYCRVDQYHCDCGNPTLRTSSAKRGSERRGSSWKDVFKVISAQSCSR
jgi:hypothetical protein